jgi:hypothetical protein
VLADLELSEQTVAPGSYAGALQVHHYRIEKREISYATEARLSARLELAADGRAQVTLKGHTEETYSASKYARGGPKREEKREKFDLALTGTISASGELPLHDAEHRRVCQLRCQPARFKGQPVLACALEHADRALFGLGVDRDRGEAGWLLLATGEGIDVSSEQSQHDERPTLSINAKGP